MIFQIFSPKNSAKKLAFLTQNKAELCKILIIFEKKRQFFRRKLSKIAENCDHNIDHVFFASVKKYRNFPIYVLISLESGVDVMITAILNNFRRKNCLFFSKTNVMNKILHYLALLRDQSANIVAEFFSENIFFKS
jgi:hypothetical protein